MRKIFCLLVSLVYGLASSFACAGCADLSNTTSWANINPHKILIYRGSKAIALLEIPYCDIYPSSSIRLGKEYICDGDKVLVASVACDIRTVVIL